MSLSLDELRARVQPHGVHLTNVGAGFTFSGAGSVFRRRWLLRGDRAVTPDLRAVSATCGDEREMAASVAGHLAELGASPMWLVAAASSPPYGGGWTVSPWQVARAALGGRSTEDAPSPEGAAPIELHAGSVVLPPVLMALLAASAGCRFLFLADAPMVVSLVPPCQVWMDSTDPRLLPAIPLADHGDDASPPRPSPPLRDRPVSVPSPDALQRCAGMLRDIGLPDPAVVMAGLLWQPETTDLISIGTDIHGREQRLTPDAAAAWRAMQRAAAADRVALHVVSAFRGIEHQRGIWVRKLASGQSPVQVRAVSAPPGFSEHHTGRAIDIATPDCEPLTESFADTRAFTWLALYAADFGFRMSYPRGNPYGLIYEPWHWTWLGRADGDAAVESPRPGVR